MLLLVDSPNLEVFVFAIVIKAKLKPLLLLTSFLLAVAKLAFLHHFTFALRLPLKSNYLPLLIEEPTSILILVVSLPKPAIRQDCWRFLLYLLLLYSPLIHLLNPPNFPSTLHSVFPLR